KTTPAPARMENATGIALPPNRRKHNIKSQVLSRSRARWAENRGIGHRLWPDRVGAMSLHGDNHGQREPSAARWRASTTGDDHDGSRPQRALRAAEEIAGPVPAGAGQRHSHP